MATSLNGTTPQATYESLLKLGDNSALTSTLKVVSDGAGNDTLLFVSTTALAIGTSTAGVNRFTIRGAGATSSTTAFRVENSAGNAGLAVLDDRSVETAGAVNIGTLAGAAGRLNFFNTNVSIQRTSGSGFEIKTGTDNAAMHINSSQLVGVGFGSAVTPTARLQVRGAGTTSATTALLVENSAAALALQVRDDGQVQLGQSTNFTVSAATTFNRYELVVGALSTVPSAILSATSTTRGFLPPRMTTTQKNAISSPAAGLVVYDTDTNKLCCYNGTSWNDLF